jgi:signal transduction histidine kinase
MRLSEFIRTHQNSIIEEWETYARIYVPEASGMTHVELVDHVTSLLQFIANDIETPQTDKKQADKSKGLSDRGDGDKAAERHAEQRFSKGFDSLQLISEFRALRASVVKLWDRVRLGAKTDFEDLVRFNEAIDQVMTESLTRYIEKEQKARTLFLSMLMHDLRNPLNAVSQAAQLLARLDNLGERQAELVQQINRGALRVDDFVSDLIDLARVRLGKGIPIKKRATDMGEVAKRAIGEIHAAHPDRQVRLTLSGDLAGDWDGVRLSQVFWNLIGNAIQHSASHYPIEVAVTGGPAEVLLSVHNRGRPIPPDLLPRIFEPLTRGSESPQKQTEDTSLGLGLFITREIVTAHGGTIAAKSNAEEGSTFTARLPRSA